MWHVYTSLLIRRFWFHFSVENVQKDQRIIFNVVNLSKIKSLFQRGMTPVVKSTSRPKWQRLPSSQVSQLLSSTSQRLNMDNMHIKEYLETLSATA